MCACCVVEHKAVVDKSGLEVHNDDANCEVVGQSHDLEDRSENHRSQASKDGLCRICD